ncbi:AmmeMemoRadiSam system protein B [Candidatus Gottesmanbacteria bacterium RBG_16_37_8]|uniref:AmmeMemoRadiSam system protein B n=1 Tax=Candidatus Gottesmanbacteria bacterium RBG_16_37_8 TaxID=1798371 RepID=A0A1F5YPZ7_9BACT|nr:MAG: AmmeMemoRadiSam system protein B [Candidatus Gottesmanbacteria bacterium RBG_16_37_8]
MAENTGAETVLLASVDFSHYLPLKEADENDRQTLTLIKNYSYAEILNLGSKFVDSPGSIVTLLKFSQKKHFSDPEVIEHVNSASLGEGSNEITTGFYLLVFRLPK